MAEHSGDTKADANTADADIKPPTIWGDKKTIDDYEGIPQWAANAMRYEWSDDFGDVGPADPELEKMLFRADEKMEAGEKLQTLINIPVVLESETSVQPIVNFDDAALHPVVLKNVKDSGYVVPTPIQAYCLPAILLNLDVIGIAQTGKLQRILTFGKQADTLSRIWEDSSLPYSDHFETYGQG